MFNTKNLEMYIKVANNLDYYASNIETLTVKETRRLAFAAFVSLECDDIITPICDRAKLRKIEYTLNKAFDRIVGDTFIRNFVEFIDYYIDHTDEVIDSEDITDMILLRYRLLICDILDNMFEDEKYFNVENFEMIISGVDENEMTDTLKVLVEIIQG